MVVTLVHHHPVPVAMRGVGPRRHTGVEHLPAKMPRRRHDRRGENRTNARGEGDSCRAAPMPDRAEASARNEDHRGDERDVAVTGHERAVYDALREQVAGRQQPRDAREYGRYSGEVADEARCLVVRRARSNARKRRAGGGEEAERDWEVD